MPRDAFTAGVVPGGLTANSEIKILICHILCEIELPICREDLLEALTGRGYANYFECADALGDLLETGHIAQNEAGMFVPTPMGRETSELLSSDIALTVRERATRQARILARRSSPQNATTADITKLETGGYRLRCALNDRDGEVFALELLAPTLDEAKRMQTQFADSTEDVVRGVYALLTGGKV